MGEGMEGVSVRRGERVHAAPKVSVVVPAYGSAWLDEALDSVRAQTYREWEIVVVDDGSPEPVEPSVADDLILVRQPNGGAGSARNRGVEISRGELVAFLDSDDTWRPEKLERQLAFHEKHACVLSSTDSCFRTETGELLPSELIRYHLDPPLIPYEKLFYENCIVTSAALTSRAAYLAVGGMDTRYRYCEDQWVWLRIGLSGPIGLLDELLVERRTHHDSLTATQKRQGEMYDHEERLYEEFLAEHPELRGEPFVRSALARLEFDRGYRLLERGEWRAGRQALVRSLKHRADRSKTWFVLLRALLHLGRPEAREGGT